MCETTLFLYIFFYLKNQDQQWLDPPPPHSSSSLFVNGKNPFHSKEFEWHFTLENQLRSLTTLFF